MDDRVVILSRGAYVTFRIVAPVQPVFRFPASRAVDDITIPLFFRIRFIPAVVYEFLELPQRHFVPAQVKTAYRDRMYRFLIAVPFVATHLESPAIDEHHVIGFCRCESLPGGLRQFPVRTGGPVPEIGIVRFRGIGRFGLLPIRVVPFFGIQFLYSGFGQFPELAPWEIAQVIAVGLQCGRCFGIVPGFDILGRIRLYRIQVLVAEPQVEGKPVLVNPGAVHPQHLPQAGLVEPALVSAFLLFEKWKVLLEVFALRRHHERGEKQSTNGHLPEDKFNSHTNDVFLRERLAAREHRAGQKGPFPTSPTLRHRSGIQEQSAGGVWVHTFPSPHRSG